MGLGRWGLRGTAALYLGLMIALPVVGVITRSFSGGAGAFFSALTNPTAISAIRLTLVTAAAAAVINAFFGTLLAYVLVRYKFPGRGLLSTLADLPLAIPTLVTGVMLAALYGPVSPLGSSLESAGIQLIFAWPGIMLALLFITLPFVLRTVQPVLLELDAGEEEASYLLGANGWTTFRRVVLPALMPAIGGGAMLTFARAVGEFGSIAIVSGNLPKTTTAPLLIFQLTSQLRYEEAAAIAVFLFTVSFVLVLLTQRVLNRASEV